MRKLSKLTAWLLAALLLTALPFAEARAQFSDQMVWGGTSGGSANAQTLAVANLGGSVPVGVKFAGIAGFTNSGATQLNIGGTSLIDVYKMTPSGPAALVGGEIRAGNVFVVIYDGTRYQLLSSVGVASSTAFGLVSVDNTTVTATNGVLSAQGVLSGYLYGLTLSNNVSDANNDIDIDAGASASDDSSPVVMRLNSSLTKRLDAAWAVGTNQGGLDTGTKANSTWYHVFEIMRPDTGVVDALFSTSSSSPTMPANYTKKRRIGAVRTDGSGNILAFYQVNNLFRWVTPTLDFDTTVDTTAQTATLTVPTGIVVNAFCNGGNQGLSSYMSPLAVADLQPSVTATPLATMRSGTNQIWIQFEVLTNTSAQIRVRNDSSLQTRIVTLGWTDWRGQQ